MKKKKKNKSVHLRFVGAMRHTTAELSVLTQVNNFAQYINDLGENLTMINQ